LITHRFGVQTIVAILFEFPQRALAEGINVDFEFLTIVQLFLFLNNFYDFAQLVLRKLANVQ